MDNVVFKIPAKVLLKAFNQYDLSYETLSELLRKSVVTSGGRKCRDWFFKTGGTPETIRVYDVLPLKEAVAQGLTSMPGKHKTGKHQAGKHASQAGKHTSVVMKKKRYQSRDYPGDYRDKAYHPAAPKQVAPQPVAPQSGGYQVMGFRPRDYQPRDYHPRDYHPRDYQPRDYHSRDYRFHDCPGCDGSGVVVVYDECSCVTWNDSGGEPNPSCPKCKGTGEVLRRIKCPECVKRSVLEHG